MANSITQEQLLNLAGASSGFVSSDIAQIVRNAHLIALRESRTGDDEEVKGEKEGMVVL